MSEREGVRERKFDSAPQWLMWLMTFINRIGFPIAVCIYLGYMQLNMMPKMVQALNNVEAAVRENTEVLRRIRN